MLNFDQDLVQEIADIRLSYLSDRVVFLPGELVVSILLRAGASREDLEDLGQIGDDLKSDPTLPFRRTRQGRFCVDSAHARIYRGEAQPFVLSAEEDFVRHDSGVVRRFDEIEQSVQENPAFQGLLLLNAMVVDGVDVKHRPGLNYESKTSVCTVFNIRTVTDKELVGEPALEGVHSDGVDHTMTTLLGSHNMSADSAKTFVLKPEAKAGAAWDQFDRSYQLAEFQHRNFLDTLIFVDYERKHSVSAVAAIDPDQEATRDMAIFFTRRLVEDGHISKQFDSVGAHQRLPLSLEIPRQSDRVS